LVTLAVYPGRFIALEHVVFFLGHRLFFLG